MSATYAIHKYEKETEPPGRLLATTPNQTPARLEPLQNRFPITTTEATFMQTNVIFIGGGTGLGFFGEFLWFASSEVAEGGLGLGLAGSSAIAAFAGTMIASFISGAIVAWTLYKDLMSEAESFNAAILEEAQKREKFHEILFFEMLRLRCFFNEQDDAAFADQVNFILQNNVADLDKPRLTHLVNQAYHSLKNKTYCETPEGVLIENNESADRFSFSHVLTDSRLSNHAPVREQIMACARNSIPGFNQSLDLAYRDIPNPPITKRWKAGLWGFAGAVGMGGSLLGSGWMVPSYLIGAGLLASIPIGGWIALVVVAIAVTCIFAYGVYAFKQKNIQREALKDEIKTCNDSLKIVQNTLVAKNFSCARKLEKQQQEKKIQAEVNRRVEQQLVARTSTSTMTTLLKTDNGEPLTKADAARSVTIVVRTRDDMSVGANLAKFSLVKEQPRSRRTMSETALPSKHLAMK
jgi:hypothetical protein